MILLFHLILLLVWVLVAGVIDGLLFKCLSFVILRVCPTLQCACGKTPSTILPRYAARVLAAAEGKEQKESIDSTVQLLSIGSVCLLGFEGELFCE